MLICDRECDLRPTQALIDAFAAKELDASQLDHLLSEQLIDLILARHGDEAHLVEDVSFLVGQLRLAAVEHDSGRTTASFAAYMAAAREGDHLRRLAAN